MSAKGARFLYELLKPQRLTSIVDIGANPIDGDPPYKAMLELGLCSLTGFEPQAEALERLNRCKGPRETYLGYAIGDGTLQRLNLTRASGMTSLLRPDPDRLKLFNGFEEWGAVTGEQSIETIRLDDVPLAAMDFLKIDVQGSEMSVFEHGRTKLSEAIGVHVEVSFVPLYCGQPPFGEIDLELRSQGFLPHAFTAIKQWPIAPLIIDGDFRKPLNQLLEADVVYVRDFGKMEQMSDEQLKHLALVAHYLYGSVDLAAACLRELGIHRQGKSELVDAYLSWVGDEGT